MASNAGYTGLFSLRVSGWRMSPTAWFSNLGVRRHSDYCEMKPKLLLHVEGGAIFFATCVIYHHLHGSWLWFAVLFLVPDISIFGYMIDKKVGAMAYNFVHTYTVPICFSLALWLFGQTSHVWLALIWMAHIGCDRLFGYGLKYETAFKDTHLNRV